MAMSSCVVDFEALRGKDGEFVVKELSVSPVASGGSFAQTWTFRPPYPLGHVPGKVQISNSWTSRNLHRLQWDQGLVPYAKLRQLLTSALPKDAHIYVKGQEKALFIAELLDRPTYELGHMGCPKAEDMDSVFGVSCRNHRAGMNCAFVKSKLFARWAADNLMDFQDVVEEGPGVVEEAGEQKARSDIDLLAECMSQWDM